MDHAANRLRIATKIHFAIRRYLGEGLDVGAMLKNPAYATEVLYVCRASRDPELCTLADQFEAASKSGGYHAAPTQAMASALAGAGPQDATWAQNTSGFGTTRAMQHIDLPLAPASATAGSTGARWYEARRWFS